MRRRTRQSAPPYTIRRGSGRAGRTGGEGALAVAGDNKHWVYGVHAVRAVLERGPERVLELFMVSQRDDARARGLREQAEAYGLRVQPASVDTLTQRAGSAAHQGVLAAIRPLRPWDEHDLERALEAAVMPLLLVLDGVTDPHNLGACLRTADAAGALALVITRDRAAVVDGVVRKVAAGAAEFLPVATVTNLARTLAALKERGLWVMGTDAAAGQTLYQVDLNRPLALVLGAEGTGLRRLTRERCDLLVRIPMAGGVDSLNVSVAAGISMFEAVRQRGKY